MRDLKLIASSHKFLLNHIAHICEILEALPEDVKDVDIVCQFMLVQYPECGVRTTLIIPQVCIRKFINASEGCGIEYPTNSTSGLSR